VLLLVVGVVLLVGGGRAFATIYNIDTDDASIDEWQNQGISVFQTDATNDTANGGTSNDDIVNVWVATGNGGDTLYFLMELNDDPALNQDNNRSGAASIDCDNDGIDQESNDRLVTYWPGNDWLIVATGDQASYFFGNATQGQRVGKYIEWSVNLSQLPPDSRNPNTNCRNQIRIRFGTADNATSPATVLDETSPLRGWNTPTTIDIKQLETQRRANLIGTLFIALMGVFFVTASVFAFHRARASQS